MTLRLIFSILALISIAGTATGEPTQKQLEGWLKQFPKADLNGDGRLTADEAASYRKKLQSGKKSKPSGKTQSGAPRKFNVDPGWDAERFPDHAASYRSPEQIKSIYEKSLNGKGTAVKSFEKPADGALRIVGTGHSLSLIHI